MRISDWSSDVCSSDLGRDAVLKKRDEGLTRRLVQFKLNDPQPLLHHNERIWRDGHIAGHITSGPYGHHLGAAVGLGYVSCEAGEAAEAVRGSRYEIEVAGERFSATARLRPMYDQKGGRLREWGEEGVLGARQGGGKGKRVA